ncbi:MAG TPA: hypothetical protein VJK03_02015 [Candidatus Nanoarchaeia archaeon]|nr:hypothetical protein [Candidatus Nanoarchaeia archaeon]
MRKARRQFWAGLGIIIFLGISAFIPITVDDGGNYIVRSHLLGVIIFYNAWMLAAYLLIALILVLIGLKRRIRLL